MMMVASVSKRAAASEEAQPAEERSAAADYSNSSEVRYTFKARVPRKLAQGTRKRFCSGAPLFQRRASVASRKRGAGRAICKRPLVLSQYHLTRLNKSPPFPTRRACSGPWYPLVAILGRRQIRARSST